MKIAIFANMEICKEQAFLALKNERLELEQDLSKFILIDSFDNDAHQAQ